MPTITEMLANPPTAAVPTTENAPEFNPPPALPQADPYADFSAPAPQTTKTDPYADFSKPAEDPYADSSRHADDLDLKTVEELDANRDTFSPKEYYAAHPELASDPVKLKKFLEVYRRRDKEGLKAGQVLKEAGKEALPTVGKIFGGARDLVAGAINVGLQPAVNLAGSVVTGDIFNPQMREELAKETKRVQKKGIAESAAGSELAATGIADLARTGLRKLDMAAGQAAVSELGEPPVEKSDQQLLQQINEDVAFSKQMQEVASGKGETAKKIGLDADTLAKEGVVLDPAVIERLSLVDPLTIVAGGGVFKAVTAAGEVALTAATRAAAEGAIGRLLARAATAPAQAAGRVIQAAGTATRAVAPYVPTFARRSVVGLVGRGAQAAGQGVARAAEAVAGSRTFQQALLGAAEGAAAAAPLAAASDEDKTAGAIFGAGALLGGGARGLVSAAEAPGRAISGRKLAAQPIDFPATPSRPYGINRALDSAHEQGIRGLPEADRNMVNSFREATRDLGGEVYVLSPDVFEQTLLENAERAKGAPLNANELASVRNVADTQGYFDTTLPAPEGQTRRAVFLNNSAAEATHEVGHLFHSLLSPERQAELINTAREVYTPDQIAQYQQLYEQQLGRPVTEDYVLNELVAENFSQLFRNTPLADLPAPPTLAQRIGRTVTDFAEEAGLDLTGQTRTPFGAPSSLRFNDIVRDAAREVLQPRPPEPVVTPRTPEGRTISAEPVVAPRAPRPAPTVSPETPSLPRGEPAAPSEQAAEARTLAAEAPDTPVAGGTRSPRELLGQIAEAIAAQEGVKLNYLSAPDEPAAATTSNRTVRREIIEAFRTMPPEARALWEKTFFPDRVTRTNSGNYQIQGWAPEVFASNAHKLARFLSETPDAQALSPYAVDPQTGTFTPEAWQELYRDTQQYVQNQMRGATGAGEPLVVPRSVTEAGGFAPQTRPGARALDQNRADFINMLFGFRLPETPRIQTGRRPLNVMGQEVSAATQPGRVEVPVRPRGEFTGEEARRQGIEGVTIAEVNPLRNQLEAVALAAKKPLPSFIEAIQRLNLENIREVQGAPEQPLFKGNTLTVSAGFQPKEWRVTGQKRGESAEVTVQAEDIAAARRLAENQGLRVAKVENADKMAEAMFQPKSVVETAAQVEKFSPSEFADWAKSLGDRGFTSEAWDVGRAAPDQQFVDSLKTRYDNLSKNLRQKVGEAIRTGNLNDVSAMASQAQFFKEAYEAATGSGSAGEALRRVDPTYEAPFPQEEPTRFQPKDKLSESEKDFRVEDAFADELLAGSKTLEDFPYYKDYKQTVESEAELLAPEGDVLFIGTGPVPISAMLMKEVSGRSVKGMELLPEAAEKGKKVTEAAGIPIPISVGDGSTATGLGKYKTIFVALEAGDTPARKQAILENIAKQIDDDAVVLARASATADGFPTLDPAFKNFFEETNRIDSFGGLSETFQLKKKLSPRERFGSADFEIGVAEIASGQREGETFNADGTIFTPGDRKLDVVTVASENVPAKRLTPEVVQQISDRYATLLQNPDVKLGLFRLGGEGEPRVSVDINAIVDQAHRANTTAFARANNQQAFFDLVNFETIDAGGTGDTILKDQTALSDAVNKLVQGEPVQIEGGAKTMPAVTDIPAQFAPKASKKKKLPPIKGEALDIFHFSNRHDLTQTNPAKMRESTHSFWGKENPKNFFFLKGSEGAPGEQFRDRTAYLGRVEKAKLYDATTEDPLKYLTQINREEADYAVRDAGYSGVIVPIKGGQRVVVMYDPVDVHPVGESTSEGTFSHEPQTQFQPKAPMEPGDVQKMLEDQVEAAAKLYPEALPLEYRKNDDGSFKIDAKGEPTPIESSYDLYNTPLAEKAVAGKEFAKGAAGKENRKAIVADAYAKKIEKAYKEAAKNPEIAAGANWYSLARKKLSKTFGPDTKFFTELLGATSAQTDVATNFRNSVDAFNNFKAGKYDAQIKKYREGKELWNTQQLPEGAPSATRAGFMKWWIEKYDLKPTKTNGKLFGANSDAVLRVLDGSWREEVKGPKTPNFAGNLSGDTFEATIDIWAARLMHRLGNEGNAEPWRILPKNETGVKDPDFFLGQAAFRKAGDKLGISPDSLQAIMWFAEKDHWAKQGWTKTAGAAKSDFNVFLNVTAKEPTGQVRIREEELKKPEPKKIKKTVEVSQ